MLSTLQYRLLPLLLTLVSGFIAFSLFPQEATLQLSGQSVVLSAGIFVATAFILGWASASLIWMGLKRHWTGNIKQQELRREKAQAASEVASDQVRALESKIATLEKALERALSSKA